MVKGAVAIPEGEMETANVPAAADELAADGQPTQAAQGTRKALIRQMISDGKTRSEVATELGIKYATVYSVSKDMQVTASPNAAGGAGNTGRVFLKDPETGEDKARADVIRELSAGGMARGAILKTLKEKYGHETSFQVVYAATKSQPKAQATASANDEETVDMPEDVEITAEMDGVEPEA